MDTIDHPPLSPDLAARFRALLAPGRSLEGADDLAPYLREERGLYAGEAAMVLRPSRVEEVSAILKLAHETRTPVVPQGGNTGLVGGQTPRSRSEIVVSLGLMDRIREVDPVGRTMTVDAGVVLQRIQEAADAEGLLFPLSLGSEGSCQIGGNLSSNAGGTGVLAYGNTRDLCLGLEAVLPTGEVFHGLRRLKKDNRGYDLRHLLVGAEGTLGIITGAVLRLYPKPAGREVAYVGLATPDDALNLLKRAEGAAGTQLTAFEIMPRIGIEFTVRHTQGARDPLAEPHPWYVLVEVSSGRSAEEARTLLESILEGGFEAGEIEDAAIARSIADARTFWRMREELSWAQKPEGGSIKHDVSVPVALVPEFLRTADAAVARLIPGARVVSFGHLGDGNIHYNVSQPVGADKAAFLARWHELNEAVHAIVAHLGGSFSAEHGIGQLKREELARTKDPVEMDLMRRIKGVLDPHGIMNPGKLI